MKEEIIGKYVRNKYGIAKIINVENNNGIDILILDKPIVFIVEIKTGKEAKQIPLTNKFALIENIDLKDRIKNLIDLIEERRLCEWIYLQEDT